MYGGGNAGGPQNGLRMLGNYPNQKSKLHEFLCKFSSAGTTSRTPRKGKQRKNTSNAAELKYFSAIRDLYNDSCLKVEVDDFLDFFNVDRTLSKPIDEKHYDVVSTLLTNTPRAVELLRETATMIREEQGWGSSFADVQRAKFESVASPIPPKLLMNFDVRIIPGREMKPINIHALRAKNAGCLIKVQGQVCKVSAVKPMATIIAYHCDACACWDFQQVRSTSYTPVSNCASTECKAARRTGTLKVSIRESKFICRQEARIQEVTENTPAGTIPKQVKLVMFNQCTRILKAGQDVTVSGVFMPIHFTGWTHPKARHSVPTYLDVHDICLHRSAEVGAGELYTDQIEELIKNEPDLFSRLAFSLAPSVHGLMDVKKSLILQMIGGVSETRAGSMKQRGEIHILLMGDPGIAKSQLLLRVCAVAPRAYFTCGKGSSGVGLTASVIRDPATGEFGLEGGAIVMADSGICCIDEFDKMKESDKTAIHEVMEQQTVSICKAGLNATLNARTTMLAAANPIYGRYDISKSAVENIGLPHALLSRFDVIFLLLDNGGDPRGDLKLARQILDVHKDKKPPMFERADGVTVEAFSPVIIRALISKAKTFNPVNTVELADTIIDKYVELRQKDKNTSNGHVQDTYVTPRTLMALQRLSQAHARVRFSKVAQIQDLNEALRLMEASQRTLRIGREGGVDKRCLQHGLIAEVLIAQVHKEAKSKSGLNPSGSTRKRKACDDGDGVVSGVFVWASFDELVNRGKTNDPPIDPQLLEDKLQHEVDHGRAFWNDATRKFYRIEKMENSVL